MYREPERTTTMQSILESQSRVTVNEEQKTLIGKTVEDLTSQIETRKGQLEINEKEVIERLDIMREQLGLEKIMKEIDGLEVDNDVKRRTADMIVEQTRLNIKSTMQSILESQSRVTINKEQKHS